MSSWRGASASEPARRPPSPRVDLRRVCSRVTELRDCVGEGSVHAFAAPGFTGPGSADLVFTWAPDVLAWYHLGAMLDRFRNPSFQILALEGERASDECAPIWPYRPIIDILGRDPAYPPWSSSGGVFAYRHKLTANFLFVDGHVEALTPEVNVNTRDRFYIEP